MESDIHVLLLVLNFQVWFSVNRTLHYSCQVKTLWSWTDLWGCCKVGFVSVIKGPWGLREFWCLQKKRIITVGKFSSKKYSFGGGDFDFFFLCFANFFTAFINTVFRKWRLLFMMKFSNEMLKKILSEYKY